MPALKDSDGNTIVSIKTKETLIKRSVFSKLSPNPSELLVSFYGLLYTKITIEVVAQVFIA